MTAFDQRADLIDNSAHRHRARIAAAVRNDAEGAAVVAAVLHLHSNSLGRPALKTFQQMRRHLGDRHDVGDRDLLAGRNAEAGIERGTRAAPCLAAHLLVIADDAIDFRHAGRTFQAGSAPRSR